MTSLSEKTDKSLKKFDYYPLVSADNDSVLVGQLLSLLVGVKCKTKRIKMSGSNAMSCTARVYVAGKVWAFTKIRGDRIFPTIEKLIIVVRRSHLSMIIQPNLHSSMSCMICLGL